MLKVIYQTLDNATIAGITTIFTASFIARRSYKEQKKQDKIFKIKEDLINEVLLLQEKMQHALLIIDRVSNSYKITGKTDQEFFEQSAELEMQKLSNIINDDIPILFGKITSKIKLYFNDNPTKAEFSELVIQLNSWHDFIVTGKFSLRQRVNEQKGLSSEELTNKIAPLIKSIWGGHITL